MAWCWEKFVIEGDSQFEHLTHNFDNFFDGDVIKHFDIRYGILDLVPFVRKLHDAKDYTEYCNGIQKELIPWIRKEAEEMRLFDKNNWKPFRDQSDLIFMYLGYKKLFYYKRCYYQLGISSESCDDRNCTFCDTLQHNDRCRFELAIYGWRDDDSNMLLPDNICEILPDNILPDYYWTLK